MWVGEMAHWGKVLVVKSVDLKVMPTTHTVKGKNRFPPSCPDLRWYTMVQI